MDSKNKRRRAIIPKRTFIYIYLYILYRLKVWQHFFNFILKHFLSPKKSTIFTKKELIRSPKSSFYSKTSIDRIDFISRFDLSRFDISRFDLSKFDSYDVYLNCMTYINDVNVSNRILPDFSVIYIFPKN